MIEPSDQGMVSMRSIAKANGMSKSFLYDQEKVIWNLAALLSLEEFTRFYYRTITNGKMRKTHFQRNLNGDSMPRSDLNEQ